MHLESLCVVHLRKPEESQVLDLGDELFHDAFRLDTCQRRIWVFPKSAYSEARSVISKPHHFHSFTGIEAYRFLLRVGTGLESQVRGETDVFGQIKEAWIQYSASHGKWGHELAHWIQKSFEDIKDVRSRFLQNIGGSSYGSLVRKIIRRHSQSDDEKILIVGAGHIARSVAPWLVDHELLLWNRNPERLKSFADELVGQHAAQVRLISSPQEEVLAWQIAAHILICIPADASLGLVSKARSVQTLIHLGAVRSECPEWSHHLGFHALDDLFSLQKQSDEAREAQYSRALKACDEKALLRSLGGSLTLPHGWEDLAVFA